VTGWASSQQKSQRTQPGTVVGTIAGGLDPRGETRPGNRLRERIPIGGIWTEGAGAVGLAQDTLALCRGALDERPLWMIDAVDWKNPGGVREKACFG